MKSYVIVYGLPRISNIEKVKIEGKEFPFYPIGEDFIGLVLKSEEEFPDGSIEITKVPSLEFLWKLPTIVFDYEEFLKTLEDPNYVPTPLKFYKEEANEDSGGESQNN